MNPVEISPIQKNVKSDRSPLRVLFISHTYVVGVNQGKLNALAATNAVEVGLLAPAQWTALAWNKRFELENPYPNIKLYPAKVLFEGKVGAYLYYPWTIQQVLADFRPDIVQVEQEVFSLVALELALWSKLTGTPLVLFCWENMERQLSSFRQWSRQFVMNIADLIISGNQEGEDLLRQWGYTGAIEVMPQMGVDPALFPPQPPKSLDRKFQIGYVGRISYHKGIDLLIAAARQLRDLGYSFEVVLCGTGPDEASLNEEAQKQNVADLLIWKGRVSHADVPKEMGQFDVLVLPSRTIPTWKEQFGHVLIEAMSMGVPAIGSTCGEIPNVIGMPELVFPEGDAKGLSAILGRMLSEPKWHQQLREYSIDRVQQHYTHERIAERLIHLWREILQRKKTSAKNLL